MAVQRKPKADGSKFVQEAPDSKQTGLRAGKRRQISLTVPDDLLAEFDRAASRNGLSRAGAINQAMRRWAEQEG